MSYKDYGKIFEISNFPAGAVVEQSIFNYDCETFLDWLFYYMSSNAAVDSVDIEIKLINSAGIETAWKAFLNVPGTVGQIDNTMMGQFVGFGFKLRAVNNSGVNITNFNLWLQCKAA